MARRSERTSTTARNRTARNKRQHFTAQRYGPRCGLGARRSQKGLPKSVQRRFIQPRPARPRQERAFRVTAAGQQSHRALFDLLGSRRRGDGIEGPSAATHGAVAIGFAGEELPRERKGHCAWRMDYASRRLEDHIIAAASLCRISQCSEHQQWQSDSKRTAPALSSANRRQTQMMHVATSRPPALNLRSLNALSSRNRPPMPEKALEGHHKVGRKQQSTNRRKIR